MHPQDPKVPLPRPEPPIIGSWCSPKIDLSTEAVGGKAAGLMRLPHSWVPPFVVLTSSFAEQAREIGTAETIARIPSEYRFLIDQIIDQAISAGNTLISRPGLFVRSNAVEESGTTSRGIYPSKAVEPRRDHIIAATESLLKLSSGMRVIIQVSIDGINGYLSNERRVTDRRDRGLLEGMGSSQSKPRLITAKHYAGGLLRADNTGAVEERLREVLGWLTASIPGHASLEWVWDGSRVWIVQFDEVLPQVTDPGADTYLSRISKAKRRMADRTIEGTTFFLATESQQWQKLSRARTFVQLGFPTAAIYVTRPQIWQWDTCRSLAANLLNNIATTWVIRTDVTESACISPDLLPTSNPTDNIEKLASFMMEASGLFKKQGLNPEQWTFIAAPLVLAKVSAMAYARPGRHDVQIDALWGFPDGLMYLPHDKYLHSPDNSIAMEIRHKPACLLYDDSGWRTMRLGPPWDRAQTLNEAEVNRVATWAQTIADTQGESVRLMALARIGGQRGENACLPFHFTTGEIAPPTFKFDASLRGVVTIRSTEDLDKAASAVNLRGIAVEPKIELVRDTDLLTRVAHLAVSRGIPVLFQGSLLAHAYHVMSKEGAAVVPLQPTTISGKAIPYQKLVRDSIPAIIERSGGVARVRTLPSKDALSLLKRKLVEEALEALAAPESSLVEELADLCEVIEALEQYIVGGHNAIVEAMIQKRQSRGGFANLVFLEATADRPIDAPPAWNSRPEPTTPAGIHITVDEPGQGAVSGLNIQIPIIPPSSATSLQLKLPVQDHQLVVNVAYHTITASIRTSIVAKEDMDQPTLFDIEANNEPESSSWKP